MRAVVQRVSSASVSVSGQFVGEIGPGLLVLLAVAPTDGEAETLWLAKKVSKLRIFSDEDGRMNRSVVDIEASVLVVSQFTLYGSCRKGNRPSFVASAAPELAEPAYEAFAYALENYGLNVQRGRFGAMMEVALVNDGPVTLIIDTP